jgi:hypothetical protein
VAEEEAAAAAIWRGRSVGGVDERWTHVEDPGWMMSGRAASIGARCCCFGRLIFLLVPILLTGLRFGSSFFAARSASRRL